MKQQSVRGWIVLLSIFLSFSAVAEELSFSDDDDEVREIYFEADMIEGSLGATPGGAQDIMFFRDRVDSGEVPHPNTVTYEGLFSEHDLPLNESSSCGALLCVDGEATRATLLVQPEVRYLAQLGFRSGLDAETFVREPLNLIAVIDKSGSMNGEPLELVKKSLAEVVERLGERDQLSVVLYGATTHVYLPPTKVTRRAELLAKIAEIHSEGSTNMEAGLALGFDLARRSAEPFEGDTRVMLFTDERPNVGRTDAESFMGMAEAASRDGVGMTTVGVGVQFGAELATKISSVRGGNLYFFPDEARMVEVFKEDFDYMVTEMAYDFEVTLSPAKGVKIAGVYGIPGDALRWTEQGGLSLSIATLFLSKRKGAIYIALAPDVAEGLPASWLEVGASVVEAQMSYTEKTRGERRQGQRALTLSEIDDVGVGLRRGWMLINEIASLKKAGQRHHVNNDQVGAYKIIRDLANLYRLNNDETLRGEVDLVSRLEQTLARLAGFEGEGMLRGRTYPDSITGLPVPPKALAR